MAGVCARWPGPTRAGLGEVESCVLASSGVQVWVSDLYFLFGSTVSASLVLASSAEERSSSQSVAFETTSEPNDVKCDACRLQVIISMVPVLFKHWPKNIELVTGLGSLFAARLVTESGGLATNPPCNKPIEDCRALHRGPRQGLVTEGPRQRFVTERGDRDKPLFRATPLYKLSTQNHRYDPQSKPYMACIWVRWILRVRVALN